MNRDFIADSLPLSCAHVRPFAGRFKEVQMHLPAGKASTGRQIVVFHDCVDMYGYFDGQNDINLAGLYGYLGKFTKLVRTPLLAFGFWNIL